MKTTVSHKDINGLVGTYNIPRATMVSLIRSMGFSIEGDDTLLTCPFCGSAPQAAGHLDGLVIEQARCSNSGCIASFKSVDYSIWNRRVAPGEA